MSSGQATIELRTACQQPWEDHMVVAALSLGIVEGASEIYRDPRIGPHLGMLSQRQLQTQVIDPCPLLAPLCPPPH